eukprot:449598_1
MLSRMSYLLALMMLLLCTGALVDAAENKEDESGGVSESASNDDEDYAYRIYAFKAQTNGMLSKFVKKKVELPKPIPSILVNALDEDNAAAFEELSKEQKAAITSSLLNDSNNLILIEAKPESTVKQTDKGPVLIYGFAFGKDDFEGPKVGISDVLQEKFRQKFQTQTSHSFARPAPMRFDSDHVRVFFSNDWKVKIRTDDGFLFPAPVTNVHKLQYEIRLLHKIEGEIEPRAEHLSSYGEFDKWFNGIIDKAAEAQPNPVPNYESNLRYRGFDPREYFNVAKFAPAYWKYSDWKAGDKVTLVVSDHNRNFVAFATVDLFDEDIEDYSVRLNPLLDDEIATELRKRKGQLYFTIPNQLPSDITEIRFTQGELGDDTLKHWKNADAFTNKKSIITKDWKVIADGTKLNVKLDNRNVQVVVRNWSWDGSEPITAFYYDQNGDVVYYAPVNMSLSKNARKEINKKKLVPPTKTHADFKQLKLHNLVRHSIVNIPPSKRQSITTDQDTETAKKEAKLPHPDPLKEKKSTDKSQTSSLKTKPPSPRERYPLKKKHLDAIRNAKLGTNSLSQRRKRFRTSANLKEEKVDPKPAALNNKKQLAGSKLSKPLNQSNRQKLLNRQKQDGQSTTSVVTEDPKDPYSEPVDNGIISEEIPDNVSDIGDVEQKKESSSFGVVMFIIILALMVGLFVWQKEYILKMFENL